MMRAAHAHALCLTQICRIKHLEAAHSQDTVVVCTHGGCMIALRCALTGVCQALQQQSLPNAWVSSNFPTIILQLHASRPPSCPLPLCPSLISLCQGSHWMKTTCYQFLVSAAASGCATTPDSELNPLILCPACSQRVKSCL